MLLYLGLSRFKFSGLMYTLTHFASRITINEGRFFTGECFLFLKQL